MTTIISQIDGGVCRIHLSSNSESFDLTEELHNILRSLAKTFPEEYCIAVEMHQEDLECENNAKNDSYN